MSIKEKNFIFQDVFKFVNINFKVRKKKIDFLHSDKE